MTDKPITYPQTEEAIHIGDFDPKRGFDYLTGTMGIYIQPRTKGAGHGSKSRAFYAMPFFLEQFIKLK